MKHLILHIICLFLLFACSQQSESAPVESVAEEVQEKLAVENEVMVYYEYPWVDDLGLDANGSLNNTNQGNIKENKNGLDDGTYTVTGKIESKDEMDIKGGMTSELTSPFSDKKFYSSFSKQKIMEMFDLALIIQTEVDNEAMKNTAIIELLKFFPIEDKMSFNDFLSIDRSAIQKLQIESKYLEIENGVEGSLIYFIEGKKKRMAFEILEKVSEEGKSFEFMLVML